MPRHLILILLWAITATGCNAAFLRQSSSSVPIEHETFVMVTAKPGDTPASLAGRYLGDTRNAWQITAYNRIETVTPGMRVVIPRTPIRVGGIRPNGYQLVPVLLYPEVTRLSPGPQAVSVGSFDLQMQHLQKNGYRTVSLDHLHAFLSMESSLPEKSVVITFDATRRWVYEIAYPILKNRGLTAAVFIRLSEVGASGRLTWSELADMAGSGFDIGILGSALHPSLQKELAQRLRTLEIEFTAPRQAFKVNLRQSCRFFAYAGGDSDDITIALLKKNGFQAAFTRNPGPNPFFTDNYKIKRSTIHGQFDMTRFKQELMTFESVVLR